MANAARASVNRATARFILRPARRRRDGSAASKGSAAAPPPLSVFPAISNRQCWRLETSVTSRKQSTAPILIDTNFAQIGPHTSRACDNYAQLANNCSRLSHCRVASALPTVSNRYSNIRNRANPLTTNEKTFSNRYFFRRFAQAHCRDATRRPRFSTAFLASIGTAVLLSGSEVDHERQ